MTIWEIAPKNWVDQKALIHLSIIDVTRDIAPTTNIHHHLYYSVGYFVIVWMFHVFDRKDHVVDKR